MADYSEFNFDGLVGPTHTFGGLSNGNNASASSKGRTSYPAVAARQCLDKANLLNRLGVGQGILPPHDRPSVRTLRELGFTGSDEAVIGKCLKHSPKLLFAVSSSSGMWTANAATVTAGPDSADGKVHLTAANLSSNLHRAIETPFTSLVLRRVFHDERHFVHHDPLLACGTLRDEGAANFLRLAPSHASAAINVFVSGSDTYADPARTGIVSRQSMVASTALARRHGVPEDRAVFLTQAQEAINKGAFHNDVLCASNLGFLLVHEAAFDGGRDTIQDLAATYRAAFHQPLVTRVVSSRELTLEQAVQTYLFNSQIVTTPYGTVCIAPVEVSEHQRANRIVADLTGPTGFSRVEFVDLRESMLNGGGPACLRLRMVLSAGQLAGTLGSVLLTPAVHERLGDVITRYYRESLQLKDLCDPRLLDDNRRALDEFTQILGLGAIYDFQKDATAG